MNGFYGILLMAHIGDTRRVQAEYQVPPEFAGGFAADKLAMVHIPELPANRQELSPWQVEGG